MNEILWDADRNSRFRLRLLRWYARNQRQLPWRANPTAYNVWVSEIMLQQTQVRTVLPYYQRFLARFPDVRTLAAAAVEDVVASWAGLGYYSRARNIHAAARRIVTGFGGRFPDTLAEWLELPGVGRYTAGAVLSIAFNQPHPVVDGNVRRVISRLHAVKSPPPESFFLRQASAWVPEDRASDFNQAMMELGALVCLPSSPKCAGCPVASLCAALKLGIQEKIPAARVVRTTEEVELVMLVVRRDGSVLLSDRVPAAYVPGPCSLPSRILRRGETPERGADALARRLGLGRIPLGKRRSGRHSITHHRIRTHVFAGRAEEDFEPNRRHGLLWVDQTDTDRFLTSSLFRKALALASFLTEPFPAR